MFICLITLFEPWDENAVFYVNSVIGVGGILRIRRGPGRAYEVVGNFTENTVITFKRILYYGWEIGIWGKLQDGNYSCLQIIENRSYDTYVSYLTGDCVGWHRRFDSDICLQTCPSGYKFEVSGSNLCYDNCTRTDD